MNKKYTYNNDPITVLGISVSCFLSNCYIPYTKPQPNDLSIRRSLSDTTRLTLPSWKRVDTFILTNRDNYRIDWKKEVCAKTLMKSKNLLGILFCVGKVWHWRIAVRIHQEQSKIRKAQKHKCKLFFCWNVTLLLQYIAIIIRNSYHIKFIPSNKALFCFLSTSLS